MKRTLCLLLGFCLIPVAFAQDEPKEAQPAEKPATHDAAIEILKKADAAAKAVKAVKYRATRTATGWLAARSPKIEGSVILAGEFRNNAPEKYFFDVRVQMPESAEARHITTGGDGETFFLIDWEAKKVHEDIDPAVVGSDGRAAMGLAMAEFVHPEPFGDEINAEAAELKEAQKVGDEDCYVIEVRYAGGRGQSAWYFSKKDHLPRRRDATITNREGESAVTQITLSDLEVDPKLDDDAFKAKVPEGFEKTDEFAPMQRSPR